MHLRYFGIVFVHMLIYKNSCFNAHYCTYLLTDDSGRNYRRNRKYVNDKPKLKYENRNVYGDCHIMYDSITRPDTFSNGDLPFTTDMSGSDKNASNNNNIRNIPPPMTTRSGRTVKVPDRPAITRLLQALRPTSALCSVSAAKHAPFMMIWLLLLTAAAFTVVIYRLQRRGIHKAYDDMTIGLPRYPVIGHGYMFRGTDEDRMNSLVKVGRAAVQQGGCSSFWLGLKLYVVIADPEAMEVVAKACLEKDEATMKYIRGVLGDGLIFAPVKIWRPRRKIMAPTFNMRKLQQFVSIFDKQSNIMVENLHARAGRGDFSLWQYITTYTFDSICETVLGIELNAQKNLHHPFITAFEVISKILAQRMLSPWLYWDWVFKLTPLYTQFVAQRRVAYDFFDEVLKDKRRELAADQVGVKDDKERCKNTFLDTMLAASGGGKGYSDIELREEVLSIVSAGTDTSAVGTAFTALMLSRYPRVQDKVYQEIKEVFGDSDRPVTWEDLPKLKYLEVVIKETLRLYPPAPVVVRDVHETIVLPNGAPLVPGTALILHLWGSHRNTKYWGEDVNEFRPERFLEGPLRHPAQFVPFSYSLRNCIGANYAIMSTKTNLANLLRRYTVLPPTSVPADQLTRPLRVEFDIMMKDCDKFQARLEDRCIK